MARLEAQIILCSLRKTPSGVPIFRPADSLSGAIVARAAQDLSCDGLTIRAAWHTEGRGDEDRQVIEEQTLFTGTLWTDGVLNLPFKLQLPEGPWSYEGKLFRIVWQVEAQFAVPWGRDPRFSAPFVLAPADRDDVAGPSWPRRTPRGSER